MKKNYWDNSTGKLNVYAVVQAASVADKRVVFQFLLEHFGYVLNEDESVTEGRT